MASSRSIATAFTPRADFYYNQMRLLATIL